MKATKKVKAQRKPFYQFIKGIVKQRIALYLINGLTAEKTAEKVSKENKASIGNTRAYVTMVSRDLQKHGYKIKA